MTTANNNNPLMALKKASLQAEKQLKNLPKEEFENNIGEEAESASPKKETLANAETVSEEKKKSANFIFQDRKDGIFEQIRIPEEIHKRLKILSTVQGTSMTVMVANILDDALKEYEKEISKIIRSGI